MKSKAIAATLLFIASLFNPVANASTVAIDIKSIYDGDTFTLSSGEKVRLLQIDTPELASGECYGKEARDALVNLLNKPGKLILKSDPRLDTTDRYGRSLRYLFKGKTNINLKLVEIGAAAPYFYRGERGKYSASILKAAKAAKVSEVGLWKSCPGTQLKPTVALTTIEYRDTNSIYGNENGKCNPNYRECLPIYPPDINCDDVNRMGFSSVHVIGKDVHKLDRDGDGVGCD